MLGNIVWHSVQMIKDTPAFQRDDASRAACYVAMAAAATHNFRRCDARCNFWEWTGYAPARCRELRQLDCHWRTEVTKQAFSRSPHQGVEVIRLRIHESLLFRFNSFGEPNSRNDSGFVKPNGVVSSLDMAIPGDAF